jgi:hypothetical protein
LLFVVGAILSVVPAHSQQFLSAPSINASTTTGGAMLGVLTWPAKGLAPFRASEAEDRTRLWRTEEFVLAGERLGFFADAATTELGFSAHCHEVDPLNTLFGSTNRLGVLGSMTGWELGFSYASVAVPHWFEHTRLRTPMRVAAIVGGSVMTGFRVRTSIRNYQIVQSLHN